MKKLTLILFVLAFTCALQAKECDLGSSVNTTSGAGCNATACVVTKGARSVTFIFSSTFTGTVFTDAAGAGGIAFTGGAGADYAFTPPIQSGDVFDTLYYKCTAGSVRVMVLR